MLKAVSFKVAWDGKEAFSHFIASNGEITVADRDAEIAKVCVIANSLGEVTADQMEAVFSLAEIATDGNPNVTLTFGAGLSPYLSPDHHQQLVLFA